MLILLYFEVMSSRKIRLSIVILAYNEEAYIGGCLRSIASQTVPADDVIVVNNNSTDRSAEIAKTFKFVRVVDEPQQGMIFARNRGFSEATGELIARIDSDSKLPLGWIEALHEAFDPYAGTIAAVSGPAYIYDLPGRLAQKVIADLVVNIAYFRLSGLMLGHKTLFGSNMVITKQAWDKVKDEVCTDGRQVHEDMDLALHIAQYGEVFFARDMMIGIAKRALDEPARKSLWRLWIWPKTVTRHRNLFAKYHPKQLAVGRK